MRYQFPRVLKAAEASERSQWVLGDALLAEVEDRQTGERGFKAVVKELEDNGNELSLDYLRSLRRTAEVFPPNWRHALPWKVHEAAGNPDTLDVIVRAAKKVDHKVTIWYISDVLKQQRDAERREREKAEAAARREREKAEAEELKAREAAAVAKTAAEKAEANRKRVAAGKRKHEANDKIKASRSMVRSKDRAAPVEEEVSMMAATTQLMSLASDSAHNGVRFEKMLTKILDELSPKMIAGLVEEAMSVANIWTRAAATMRKASPVKRSHLQVVNE